MADHRPFEVVCEIQPPVTPDLGIVREQITVLQPHCDAFLVPDSHLGRATVSSIAVAHEVGQLGGRAIACVNARDRNLLGFRRDLLTAAADGVRELLFVYGDAPQRGDRSTLRVRDMLAELGQDPPAAFRVGVAADVTRDLPGWKRPADFVCTQVGFDAPTVARWRERAGFGGHVYAGVVVLASRAMAQRLADLIPGFTVPDAVLRDLDRGDPTTGVEVALTEVERLRATGAVDGVQLIPARRYRQLADALARPRGG